VNGTSQSGNNGADIETFTKVALIRLKINIK
jgi:hypothetical protein